MLISRGSLQTFLDRPISATFLALCLVLILAQIYARFRKSSPLNPIPTADFD
jgi:putative tricarboxylic transport membrane protein